MPSCAPDSMKLVRLVTASARLADSIALCGLRGQARAVDGHVGEFLGDEVAVGGDDRQDHQNAEQKEQKRLDHRTASGRLRRKRLSELWSTVVRCLLRG